MIDASFDNANNAKRRFYCYQGPFNELGMQAATHYAGDGHNSVREPLPRYFHAEWAEVENNGRKNRLAIIHGQTGLTSTCTIIQKEQCDIGGREFSRVLETISGTAVNLPRDPLLRQIALNVRECRPVLKQIQSNH